MSKINQFISPAKIFFAEKPGVQKFIPAIVWFFMLFILLMLPGSDLPKTNDWLNKIFFDKWIHAGLFGLLALLLLAPVMSTARSFRKIWLSSILIVFAVSLWGITTEFLQQALVDGRSFDIYAWNV